MQTQVKTHHQQLSPQQPMTKQQAADYFQVSERTIDRWRAEGKLKCFKFRGTVRFRPEWIEELLRKNMA